MARNPWATSRVTDTTVEPDYPTAETNRYAVPTGDAPFNDEFGWSPHPRKVVGNTPDPYRLGESPLIQHYPMPGQAPEIFYGMEDADRAKRHSVETVDANGWNETKAYPGYPAASAGANRWAPNPRSTPPPESRITQQLSPRRYSFTRPFGSGPHRFNGLHFSMADHSRNYEILGMRPAPSRRNTYRLEPQPWDANIVDMPTDDMSGPNGRVAAIDVPYTSKSWRL